MLKPGDRFAIGNKTTVHLVCRCDQITPEGPLCYVINGNWYFTLTPKGVVMHFRHPRNFALDAKSYYPHPVKVVYKGPLVTYDYNQSIANIEQWLARPWYKKFTLPNPKRYIQIVVNCLRAAKQQWITETQYTGVKAAVVKDYDYDDDIPF